MANPIAINGTHERQERYSALMIPLLRAKLVTEAMFRRDYEGSPISGAVNIPVRLTEVSVRNYDIKNGIDLEQSATTYLKVLIDEHKAVNELIDGYEAAAVPDNLTAQRLESGAYSTAKHLELARIGVLETQGTISTNTVPSTAETAYENILDENLALDLADVPADERIILARPEFIKLLKLDKTYAGDHSAVFQEIRKMGLVGLVDGIPVYKSNLLASTTEFILGSRFYMQAIDEWSVPIAINDIRDGKHIGASALQGRMIYNNVVTNELAVRVKTKV